MTCAAQGRAKQELMNYREIFLTARYLAPNPSFEGCPEVGESLVLMA